MTPRLTRVTVAGAELVGLPLPEPAGSIRLLLPEGDGLVIPEWNGNRFVFADGSHPTIRTLTPVDVDPRGGRLGVEIVQHGEGRASDWAAQVPVGAEVAVSGPARGYVPTADATDLVLGGDESAIPALRQIAAAAGLGQPVVVLCEIAQPAAQLAITDRPNVAVTWLRTPAGGVPGDALAGAFATIPIGPGTQVWAAGEAAAMQRIRRTLFDRRSVERTRVTVRGYWKHGRSAGGPD